jgi:hypothetical protein
MMRTVRERIEAVMTRPRIFALCSIVVLFVVFACGSGGGGEIAQAAGDGGGANDGAGASDGAPLDAASDGSKRDSGPPIDPSATGTCGQKTCAAGTYCDIYVPGVPCPPDGGDCGSYDCRPLPAGCTSCECIHTCEGSCNVSTAGFATASCYGA